MTWSLDRVDLARNDLMDVFSKFSQSDSSKVFFNSSNLKEDLHSMRSSVTVLQKEAATISALTQALRAMVKPNEES